MRRKLIAVAIGTVLFAGCAGLDQLRGLVQPPRFEQAPDHQPEIRLLGFSGAGVRLWTKVTNPNPFGLRLGTLKGTLFLEDTRAADADFPLGMPLSAMGDTTIPIDLSVSFANLPGLADSIRRAINHQTISYRFDGTIGVDAGRLGQPMFGPMTLLRGELR
jgi:hypothetical protein